MVGKLKLYSLWDKFETLELHLFWNRGSKCIAKSMHLEKSIRLIIWDGASSPHSLQVPHATKKKKLCMIFFLLCSWIHVFLNGTNISSFTWNLFRATNLHLNIHQHNVCLRGCLVWSFTLPQKVCPGHRSVACCGEVIGRHNSRPPQDTRTARLPQLIPHPNSSLDYCGGHRCGVANGGTEPNTVCSWLW